MKLVLLDDDGLVVAKFEVGHETLAEQVCKIVNRNNMKDKFKNNGNYIF